LPGGPEGAKNFAASELLGELLRYHEENGKYIAAICRSAALVLKTHGVARGKRATCYPAFKDEMEDYLTFVDEAVVQDGKLITSQGPATVIPWVMKIAENLVGEEGAKEIDRICLFSKFYKN
jgi:putative intracellular protease/amidase